MPDGLPNPVGREDAYLAAILDEIKGMREDMAKFGIPPRAGPGVEVTNTVELREGTNAAGAVETAGQELGRVLAQDAPTDPPAKSLLQRISGR
jgi:hypothetical protein